MDGRKVEFIIQQPNSNQWVEEQHDLSKNLTTFITRDFNSDNMKVGLLAKGVAAVSLFRRRKPVTEVD